MNIQRYIITSIFLVLFTTAGVCQLSSSGMLPVNEEGKVTFSEIVKVDSTFGPTLLYNNSLRWVSLLRNDNKKPMVINEYPEKSTVEGSNMFFVYQETMKVGVLRKIYGAVHYDFKIESRQGRYKYTFTNFVFHFYDRMRINSYEYLEPKPNGRTKKLEDPKASGWIATWRGIKMQVSDRMFEYSTKMNKYMTEDTNKEKFILEKKKVEQEKLKENW
jgi:hypothetical protein